MGGIAAPYIEIAYGYVSLAGEAKCAAGLAILLLCAFLFTYMVQKVKALLFFLVGAAGAGFGAYMSSGLVTPLVAAQLGAPIPDNYVLYACGGIGLLGGLLFGSLAEKLLDFVLGVFGSVVLAMGAINLALADFLTAELVATLKLEAYYMFYVGGIGAVLFLLRRSLVNVREPEKSLRGKARRVRVVVLRRRRRERTSRRCRRGRSRCTESGGGGQEEGLGRKRCGETRRGPRWRLAACGCLRHGRCRIAVAGARVPRHFEGGAGARAARSSVGARHSQQRCAPCGVAERSERDGACFFMVWSGGRVWRAC